MVIGNVGVDTNVYLHSDDPDLSVESNFTLNLDCVGQAGGYTALGYARLGYRVAVIGHVGADFAGAYVRQVLEEAGVDTAALFIDPAGTARSVNMMSPDGTRRNFYDGKSHMTLEPDLEVCEALLARARLVHCHLPNWARRLLPLARRHQGSLATDLQDMTSPDDEYRRDFITGSEILFLSSVNRPAEELIGAVLEAHPRALVIAGMGDQGCAAGVEGIIRRFPPVDLGGPVVDTNGAGDSLAVGVLSSYILDGHSLSQSLLRGQIAARHACTQKGVSHGLITRKELDERHRRLR